MCIAKQCRRISNVALRKESVDRNLIGCINRAIDIIVALRKESVDRNKSTLINCNSNFTVALRKESVDRNAVTEIIEVEKLGRSPQGERG